MIIIGLSKIYNLNGIKQTDLRSIQSWYYELSEFCWDVNHLKQRFPDCEIISASKIDFFIHERKYRISTEINLATEIMLIKGILKYGD